MSVLGSLAYGLANLFHPKMLWLMVWPMLVSLIAWGTVALFVWTKTALWIADLMVRYTASAAAYINLEIGNIALVLANVVLILLFVPLVYVTALFILGIFGMNAMVEHVAARSYPTLDRRRGGGVTGSAINAVVAFVGMVALFVLALPLWIVPPLWPLIPVGVLAWVNQRLLRYDALAEHADREEMHELFRERRAALYGLGIAMALSAFIPLAGFLVPVAFGLAYIHYLLGALARRRQEIAGPDSPALLRP